MQVIYTHCHVVQLLLSVFRCAIPESWKWGKSPFVKNGQSKKQLKGKKKIHPSSSTDRKAEETQERDQPFTL